jgi:isopenicillin N synthase-like dioxygenase
MGDSDLQRSWNGREEQVLADPDHHPSTVQWPDEEDLPGFKTTFLRYLEAVENLSNEFTELVAEALGLPSDGLARFYGSRDRIQHRSKVRIIRSTIRLPFPSQYLT